MHRFILLALVIVLMSAGCAPVKPAPDRHFYVIEAAPPAVSAQVVPGTVLKVRAFSISPAYADRRMVYRSGGSAIDSDYYNLYFVPPAEMITGQTVARLADTGPFEQVTDISSRVVATHYLEGAVTALYGDWSDPASPKAVLRMQFALIMPRAGGPHVLLKRDYQAEEPLASADPRALADGLGQALGQVLDRFVADLAPVVACPAP